MSKEMAGMGFFWREEMAGGNPVTLTLQELTVRGERVRFGLIAKGYGAQAVYIGGYFAERLVSFLYEEPVKRWQEGQLFTGEDLQDLIHGEIDRAMEEIYAYCRWSGEEGRLSFRGILLIGREFVAFEKGEGAFLFQEKNRDESKLYRVRLSTQRKQDCYGMAYGYLYEDGLFFSMDEADALRSAGDVMELMERRQSECIYLLM